MEHLLKGPRRAPPSVHSVGPAGPEHLTFLTGSRCWLRPAWDPTLRTTFPWGERGLSDFCLCPSLTLSSGAHPEQPQPLCALLSSAPFAPRGDSPGSRGGKSCVEAAGGVRAASWLQMCRCGSACCGHLPWQSSRPLRGRAGARGWGGPCVSASEFGFRLRSECPSGSCLTHLAFWNLVGAKGLRMGVGRGGHKGRRG